MANAFDIYDPVREDLMKLAQDRTPLQKRRDLCVIVEVPAGVIAQGDPDMDNMPRMDPINRRGFMTDSGLKRQIRDAAVLHMYDIPGYDVFVTRRAVQNLKTEALCSTLGITAPSGEEEVEEDDDSKDVVKSEKKPGKKPSKKARFNGDNIELLHKGLCEKYFDVRAFGQVTGTEPIRAPFVVTMGWSVSPIVRNIISITNVSVRTEREADKQNNQNRTMGKRPYNGYGLYVFHVMADVYQARRCGFSEGDFAVTVELLRRAWQERTSTSKLGMNVRQIACFEHEGAGRALPAAIYRLVKIQSNTENPMCWEDYTIDVDAPPNGVQFSWL
jgi:CRISPR-associated protein Csd2